jgi:hypothetical protein
LTSFKLIWESLKNFAKANEVAALANQRVVIVKLPIPTLTAIFQKKRPANDNRETPKMILHFS